VLQRFLALVGRFRRDEGGAFLVLFGIMAIVLVATSGAVVDFTRIEQARTKAQNALDAAALGLQPHVFDTSPAWTSADFILEADKLLEERLGDSTITAEVTGATINVRNGQLILNAWIDVPTAFVAILGITQVRAGLLSEATRKRLNLEVAMVLDNSGSMSSYSRMTELKAAAKSATNILFDGKTTQPNVFVSIIPFTQYVNVGTANRTASWMSQTGASSVSHFNFDNDDRDDTPFTSTVSRWSLYDGFSSGSWTGCVEARITPYDTQDTVPNNAVPDTMFQPVFAPDSSADNWISSDTGSTCRVAPRWIRTETKANCGTRTSINETRYNDCSRTPSTSYSGTNEWGATVTSPPTTQPANNSVYSYYNNVDSCPVTYTSTVGSTNRNYNRVTTCSYTFSSTELQQRICKYAGKAGAGANSDCPTTSILPLNNVRATVDARIDAMVASGSTNIEQGSIWGFHSLSPTQPLTEGRSYDDATAKIMIVMTDGENNVNYTGYGSSPYGVTSWTAWGYRSDKRLLTESTTPRDSVATSAQVIAEVNRRTVLACANARAAGITVYTIGLSAPNNTTIQMLKDCATPSKTEGGVTTNYWYFPTNSSQLTDVFTEIAEQLSELRLAQ